MLSKRSIINTLFVVGFPFYGMGTYIGNLINYTVGNIWSITPFLGVVLFYLVDLMQRERPSRHVNLNYGIALVYLLTLCVALLISSRSGFPGLYTVNMVGTTLTYLVPFHAALVVVLYNRERSDLDMSRLVLTGLVSLVLLNLVAYAAGFRNLVHGFEGRMNLPFFRGIYDGAHILAVINLMLLFHLRDPLRRPVRFALLSGLFAVNLVVTMSINSRLSFMIFLVISLLFITRAIRRTRFLYLFSLFTLPLLMSFSLLIYNILSMPIFERVLQRVDKADVVTFNGRTFIWSAAWEWLMHDRRGILIGNGYQGQYNIRLLEEVGVMWGEENTYNLHMHSTFLQVLLGQGVIGVLLMYVIFLRLYRFYRKRYMEGATEMAMFGPIAYMLIIWQMDIFCFGQGTGAVILFCAFALLCVDRKPGGENASLAQP